MYKHILIPIDDSKLSEKAIKNGIALASSMRARVTGFTAVPAYQSPSETVLMSRTAPSIADHNRRSKKKADAILGKLARRARAAGVKCDTYFTLSDRPDDAIVAAATKSGC